MACTVSHEVWYQRIQAARRRREKYEDKWSQYGRLHTNVYTAMAAENDELTVTLPSGDQVKVGIVYRNVEQTMALLEVPEISIRATAQDFTRELGREDSHRENIVETGIQNSMEQSGLLKGADESDDIKRDGVIVGHAINYSWWRVIEREVEVDQVQVMVETTPGMFEPLADEATGMPVFEPRIERQVVYEGVEDERVPPNQFLFDAGARKMYKSPWHGWERPVKLEELKRDPRYTIPDDIEPTAIRVKDIYGDEPDADEVFESDSVMVITIWDKENQELITFIEHATKPGTRPAKKKGKKKNNLPAVDLDISEIGMETWPVKFSHPDDSPFTFFVPSPANDLPFGISQIEHIKNQAMEADKLRTRAANLTRELKIVLLYQKGRIDQDTLTQAIRAPEATPVGVEMQDGDDWSKLIKEIQPAKIPPEIYEHIRMAEEDVRRTTAVSEVPFGGAETATESENQMAVGGARPKRKRRLFMAFLSEVARRHKDYLRQFAPEGQTMAITGADGMPLTLEYGRAAFDGRFKIEVAASGEPASPVQQKMMVEMGNAVFQKFGPVFDRIFLRQYLTAFNVRDVNALAQAAQFGLQPLPAPGQEAAPPNINDVSNGQAIRAAINAPNEGRIR